MQKARRARPDDAGAIARLFYETIHRVNARDYRPDQLRAWAPRVRPEGFWKRRQRRYRVWVTEEAGEVTGFAELGANGGIDCFYVHHAWQGRGVGTALLRAIEREARVRGIRYLSADASITALPFFRARGFRVVRRQRRVLRNRSFRQYRVIRRAAP